MKFSKKLAKYLAVAMLSATIAFGAACGGNVTENGSTSSSDSQQTGSSDSLSSGESSTPIDPVDPPPDPPYVPPVSKNIASKEEIAKAKAFYSTLVADVQAFPATFKLDGTAYKGFPSASFTVKSNVKTENEKKTQQKNVITVEHKESGLIFEITTIFYENYAAYDWVIYLQNPTDHDSPVVSDLQAINLSFEGENPTLYYTAGDQSHFTPETEALKGKTKTFSPDCGRSTEGAFPYYIMDYGAGGMILALGWAGQWECTFDGTGSESKVQVTAGQQTVNTYLKAGEQIRTPSVSIINYEGHDSDRTSNLWRRWYIDNIMYRVEDENGEMQLFEPQTMIAVSNVGQSAENVQATEEGIKKGLEWLDANGVTFDYAWLDAGWYFDVDDAYIGTGLTSWQTVGTWKFDTNRFPTMGKEMTDKAKELGYKGYILWFEPERFTINLDGLKEDGSTAHAEWILGGAMYDLSNDEAMEWMLQRILSVMQEGGFTLYREDMNVHTPLDYWTAKDAVLGENREGITENKYLQNHFLMWEEIAKFTNTPIDACASGGYRLDLDTMRYAVSLHRSDYGYSDSKIQQCYSLEMFKWFPYFSVANPSNASDKYFNRYGISAFQRFISLTYDDIVPDLDMVLDGQEEFDKVSRFIYADYYELLPYSYSDNNWMSWELFDDSIGEGYAVFFRHSNADATKTIALKGLEADRMYHIWFEDRGQHAYLSGAELMEGIEVTLPAGETSDILYIAQRYEDPGLTARITRTSLEGLWGDAIQEIDNQWSRFDVRFNRSLRDTVLGRNEGTLETDIVDVSLLNKLTLNGTSLVSLVAAENARVNYDVETNILQIYFKTSAVDITEDITVTISKDLENFEGVKPGSDISYVYDASVKAWAENEETAVPNENPNMGYYDDPETFDRPEDVNEEVLSGIKYTWPWAANKSGIFSWSYNAQPGYTSYSVFKLTQEAQYQYQDGKQAILVNPDKMKVGTDYFLDVSLKDLEPGQYMTVKAMVYCGLKDTDALNMVLRNENNAEGGDLGNYISTGKLIQGEWSEWTISFIANPAANGNQLLKFGLYPKYDGAEIDGYLVIDNIRVVANEMEREEQTQYNFEDGMANGSIGYKPGYTLKGSDSQGFYTWDYPSSNQSIFSVQDGAVYGADSKVIVADLTDATKIIRQNDAGYFLDYLFRDMEAEKTYYLTFRMKGVLASKVGVYAMPERNFNGENSSTSTIVQGYEYTCNFKNGEWTDVKVAFRANPDATGSCCLRLSVRASMGETGSGKIVFDNFKLSKSLFNTEEFGTIGVAYPWSYSTTKTESYATWCYDVPELRIFRWDDDGYEGRGIVGDLSGANSEVTLAGGGYFLDYYRADLETDKTYILRFAYKNMLTDAIFDLSNEPNGCSGIVMSNKTLSGTSEWKVMEVRFTVGDDYGLWGFRFSVYPTKGKIGGGTVSLDILGIEEYEVVPDPAKPTAPAAEGEFFEDKLADIYAMAPWDGKDNVAHGGFGHWTTSNFPYLPTLETFENGSKYIQLTLDSDDPLGSRTMDMWIPDLKAGYDYTLSFYVKASENLNLNGLVIRREHSFTTVVITETRFTQLSTEWQLVTVTFTAQPDETTGLCAVAIDFVGNEEGAVSGSVWLDCFSLTEIEKPYVVPVLTAPAVEGEYFEDKLAAIYAMAPWDGKGNVVNGGIAHWVQGTAPGVQLVNYDGATGKYLVADFTSQAALAGTRTTDLYVSGLETGKEYKLSFYVKATEGLTFASIHIGREHSWGTVTMSDLYVTELTAEWQLVTVTFTAQPDEEGLCAIAVRFNPNPEAENVKGAIYLDCISVTEVKAAEAEV